MAILKQGLNNTMTALVKWTLSPASSETLRLYILSLITMEHKDVTNSGIKLRNNMECIPQSFYRDHSIPPMIRYIRPDADTNTPPILNTFTCFPDLPSEIRVKIWHHCFPAGRKIRIYFAPPRNMGCHCAFNESYRSPNSFPAREYHALPTTLFINQESRHETKNTYTIFLPSEINTRQFQTTQPICFAYERDRINIGFCLCYMRGSSEIAIIKNIHERIPPRIKPIKELSPGDDKIAHDLGLMHENVFDLRLCQDWHGIPCGTTYLPHFELLALWYLRFYDVEIVIEAFERQMMKWNWGFSRPRRLLWSTDPLDNEAAGACFEKVITGLREGRYEWMHD